MIKAISLGRQFAIKGKHMKRQMKLVGTLIATALLFGCSTAQFQRESAGAIGGNIDPEQVIITEMDKSASMWKWNATVPTGKYKCSVSLFDSKTLCFVGQWAKKEGEAIEKKEIEPK
ncbi:MAG: hypothetical protein Q7T53_10815 [Deltaproteobacteria bacterium]|nr:hypothetical protein [Deltaproteobacteria bacterium]